MPIITLGHLGEARGLVDQWKHDLEAGWKAAYDKTLPIYGTGLVESVRGTWDEIISTLRARWAFSHPQGEIPEAVVQEWYAKFQSSKDFIGQGQIPGFDYYGKWNSIFGLARKAWLDGQAQKVLNAQVQEATTLMLQAERAATKLFLDMYGDLLAAHGGSLSADEKEFMRYFFLDWKILKSDADKARATQILQRVGYKYNTPQKIHDQLYQVYLAAGGKPEDYMRYASSVDYKPELRQVISNGSSNPLTAVDWNQVQANQKVVTQLTEDAFVSPLNTMFLSPAKRQVQAASQPSPEPALKTPLVVAGLGFLLWKLIRR